MSGIAEVLINEGYEVTGSDKSRSTVTEHLEKIGARIAYKHEAKNVDGCQVVVTSTAVKPDNVEVQSARKQTIPVIPRAEMLAELMRMKQGIAIAGTHGKTTTTSLVATVLAGGNLDPTVVIGGKLKSVGSHAKMGQSEFLVAEADESDGSFLKLTPTIAVVTTLDEEHMDFYKTLDNIKEAFLTFLNKIPFYGTSVLCLDETNIQSLIPRLEKRFITYGLVSQGDYTARNIRVKGLDTQFDVFYLGDELGTIHSVAPGKHNVLNTLAAVAVGMELNLTFDTIAQSLKQFKGVQRRFEIHHNTKSLVVVDDYGHHPVEIAAVLKAARQAVSDTPDARVIAIHQPHRFTRLASLFDDFCSCFDDADIVGISEVYAAGEDPIPGASRDDLVAGLIRNGHHDAQALISEDDLEDFVRSHAHPGDIVVCLGAGTISAWANDLPGRLMRKAG